MKLWNGFRLLLLLLSLLCACIQAGHQNTKSVSVFTLVCCIVFYNSYLLEGNVFAWRTVARILPPDQPQQSHWCDCTSKLTGREKRPRVCCVKLQVHWGWCSLQWQEWIKLWHRCECWLLSERKGQLSSCTCVWYPTLAGILEPSVEGCLMCFGSCQWLDFIYIALPTHIISFRSVTLAALTYSVSRSMPLQIMSGLVLSMCCCCHWKLPGLLTQGPSVIG